MIEPIVELLKTCARGGAMNIWKICNTVSMAITINKNENVNANV